MGFNIGRKRLGVYGSEDIFMALLFGGYALGPWPESRRVLRWVAMYTAPFKGDWDRLIPVLAPGIPTEFFNSRKPADLQRLLDYGHNGSAWVDLARSGSKDIPTVERGLKRKPVRCPILAGLVTLYRCLRCECRVIKSRNIPAICVSIESVLPNLTLSPWFEDITEVLAVLYEHEAERREVPLG